MVRVAIALAVALCGIAPAVTVEGPPIRDVKLSRPFFNPSLGERIGIEFSIASPGSPSITILDRDGFAVRRLLTKGSRPAGKLSFEWDGRDDSGFVVPDEAYSLKIDLDATNGSYSYFPARLPPAEMKAEVDYYDRVTGVLRYRLSMPARVHAQAGISHRDASGVANGPVLKTLVNREPRPGGALIEAWNGLDETGSYYVPDLPDFAVAVAADGLPENSMIAIGNANQRFPDYALNRSGASLLTDQVADHRHHKGLASIGDASPGMYLRASNARLVGAEKVWTVKGSTLRGSLFLSGASAESFSTQPGALLVYVDAKRVAIDRSPRSGMPVAVPLTGLAPGRHVIAFDWASEYGPVAVTSIQIQVRGQVTRVAERRGGNQ